jgi:hypothetical protein
MVMGTGMLGLAGIELFSTCPQSKDSVRVSDSHWHHQLSQLGEQPPSEESPYWLGPFQNYKTFCPYLVGSYDRVSAELARYLNRYLN